MNSLKYWTKAVFSDLTIYSFLYLYFIGYNQALSVVVFFCWLVSLLRFAMSFSKEGMKEVVDKCTRPFGFKEYRILTELVYVVVLVWIGCTLTAAAYIVSSLFFESARLVAEKEKQSDQ